MCADFIGTLPELKEHITEEHGLWWGAYKERRAEFTCQTCSEPLDEPAFYCNDTCRDKDTSPPNPCPWCGTALPHDIAPVDNAHDCPDEPDTHTAPEKHTEDSTMDNTHPTPEDADTPTENSEALVSGENVVSKFDFEDHRNTDDERYVEPPPGEEDKPEYPLLSADSDGNVDFEVSLGSTYDVDANFICDECNDFSTDNISVLREHVESDSELTWNDYLNAHPLHRCAHCETVLSDIGQKYCEPCESDPEVDTSNDKVPCQFCGTTWVRVDDPFCSAECAAGALEYGGPLDAPTNPDDAYLSSPLRSKDGIPSSAPVIHTYRFVCRHCYEYGSDDLHGLATHVGKGHDIEWAEYIHRFHLRECRTCESALYSLTTRYCDMECQRNDPDPVDTCIGCGGPVDIGNIFCCQACFHQNQDIVK